MAKREVNTKFVITMAVVLTASAGAMGAYAWKRYAQAHDPKLFQAKAELALQAGNPEEAIGWYAKAYDAAHKKGLPSAVEYAEKEADLLYDSSAGNPKAYKQALDFWKAALQADPTSKVSLDRLVHEYYLLARHGGFGLDWPQVEKQASDALRSDPDNGEAYMAEGVAIRQQLPTTDRSSVRYLKVQSDLKRAVELAPDNIEALAALSAFEVDAANDLEKSNKTEEAKKLRTSAQTRLTAFMDKNPTNVDARLAYVELLVGLNDVPSAMDALEKAETVIPDNPKIYLKKVELYASPALHDLADAEKCLIKALDLDKGDLGARLNLAKYYQAKLVDGKILHDKAIEQFLLVINTKSTAKGMDAFSQQGYIQDATENLCWEYMDVAQGAGITSPEGSAAMAKARDVFKQIERVRPTDVVLKLFDGRMDLMEGRIAPATMKLTQANDVFSGHDAGLPNWRRTKLLLVEAYSSEDMYGNAIDFLNQLLQQTPNHPLYLLQRSALQIKLKQYNDAFMGAQRAAEVLKVLKGSDPKIDDKPALRLELAAAEQLLASPDGAQLRPEVKDTLVKKIDDLRQALGSTTVDTGHALDLLLAGNAQEAIGVLEPVVQQVPDNMEARYLLVEALLQQRSKLIHNGDSSHAEDLGKEAKDHLDILVKKFPNEPRIKAPLAMLENPKATPDEIQRELIGGIVDEYQKDMAWAAYDASLGKVDEELSYLKKAEAANPDDNSVVDRIFQVLLQKQDWAQAQDYLQKAVLKNIDGVNGKFYQGWLELARGHLTDAIATLKTAVALRPDYAMGQALLAKAYTAAGQLPAAEDAFTNALKQSPDNIAALKGLIQLNIVKRDKASLDKAVDFLKTALSYAPNDPDLRNFQDLIGDPKDAIARREAIRVVAPKDYDNLQRLALVYQRAGDLKKAIAIYQPVVDAMPDNLFVADNMAKLMRAAGMTNDALKIYQSFIASDKQENRFIANLMLGDLTKSMGQLKDAEDYYRTAIKNKPQPDNTEGERKLADMLFENGNFVDAEVLYESLVKSTDDNDPLVLNRFVETLIRQAKYDKADQLLKGEVLKKNPNDQESIILLGYLRMSQGRVKDANDVFDSAIGKDPNSINGHYYRALLQFASQGDLGEAIQDLMVVRRLDPSNVKARELMARVYRQTGKYNEAVQEYQAVLERAPERAAARLELAQFLLGMVQTSLRIPADSTQDYPVMIRAIKPTETLTALLADSIKAYPDQPVWQVLQGNLAEALGQNQEALAIYVQVWKAQQQSADAAIPMLTALLKAKNYEMVIRQTTQMMPAAPNNISLWLKRAEAYAGQPDTQKEALADFAYSLDKTLSNGPAYLQVASEMGQSLPRDVAVGELQKRADADPKHIPTRLALAQMQLTAGKFAEAAAAVEPLLNDDSAKSVKPVILRVLATAAYQEGKIQEAADYYKTLVELVPDDIASLNNLAFILADDLKKPADATPYADRAMKVLKLSVGETVMLNNGNVMDTYGWVKYRNGDLSGAIVALGKSLESDPVPLTYYHRALVYQAQKKLAAALTDAQSCVDLATKNKDTAMLQKAQALMVELKASGK